jgi:hypothetical protein
VIWDKAASQAGRYADTDYVEPLARFGRCAYRLAKNGYSSETFGGFVRDVFEREKLRTWYAVVLGRFANFTVPRLLPSRWLERLIARNVGLA